MESTPSLGNVRATAPIYPRSTTISRPASQDSSQIVITGNCDSAAFSSVSSKSSYLLLEGNDLAALGTNPSDPTMYSDTPNEHNTEQKDTVISGAASGADYQSLRTRSRFQNVRKIVVKFWFWEAAACVFSLISLASIVGVLIYEDGKPLDAWDWSIPPTATVSFIGTLSKASMVLSLSQILSQLKWLHFRETKSLRDVRIFDGASRGPLGAVLIIWNCKKLLASIGACMMILTILVDPFVQLVFTFPSKLVEDKSQQAIFQRTISWEEGTGDIADATVALPPQRIVAAINEGLASTAIVPAAICPSGNCIWPEPIKTLGVCGSCSDMAPNVEISCFPSYNNMWEGECSDLPKFGRGFCNALSNKTQTEPALITTTVQTCNYTWEGRHTIQAHKYNSTLLVDSYVYPSNISRTVWNSTSFDLWEHIQNLTIRHPLDSTKIEINGHLTDLGYWEMQGAGFIGNQSNSYIYLLDRALSSFHALQLPALGLRTVPTGEPDEMPAAKCWSCELYWCEKSFEAVQITDNAAPEYKVSTERLWFAFGSDNYLYGLFPSDLSMLNETVWNFRYRTDYATVEDLSNLFQTYFVQYVSPDPTQRPQFWGESPPYQFDLASDAQAVLGLAFSKDLNATIQHLADSLTEVIRTGRNSANTIGQTLVVKSFIQVRWTWLALPLALVVMTCVLLLIVSIKSHLEQIAVWKDDPLALLFHNVHGAEILPGSKIGTSDLDNLADEVHVRLDQNRPFQFVVSTKPSTRNVLHRPDEHRFGRWKQKLGSIGFLR